MDNKVNKWSRLWSDEKQISALHTYVHSSSHNFVWKRITKTFPLSQFSHKIWKLSHTWKTYNIDNGNPLGTRPNGSAAKRIAHHFCHGRIIERLAVISSHLNHRHAHFNKCQDPIFKLIKSSTDFALDEFS